jgi:hypothetical protein
MPLNELVAHRPSVRAYHGRNRNPWLRMASVYRRATEECDGSTAGHWDSGSVALTISLRRCRAPAYTSSAVLRFTDMLLSPRPFGSRLVVHLGVICPELRPPPVAILSVRYTAHTFALCSSSLSNAPFKTRLCNV